jgi:hypothetical protein
VNYAPVETTTSIIDNEKGPVISRRVEPSLYLLIIYRDISSLHEVVVPSQRFQNLSRVVLATSDLLYVNNHLESSNEVKTQCHPPPTKKKAMIRSPFPYLARLEMNPMVNRSDDMEPSPSHPLFLLLVYDYQN